MLELFSKKNSRSLFEQLINEHHAALYKHALWMTGKQDIAADMTQETFYQAWQCVNSLKDQKKALPWLLTILRRTVYREQRYQYRQIETIKQLSMIDENQYSNDDLLATDLYSAFESISTKHRDVFLLHNLHGFTYDEISEQLNIPKGTVMSRLARAKEALRKILDHPHASNVIQLNIMTQEQQNNEQ